jgi:hypothetical protein
MYAPSRSPLRGREQELAVVRRSLSQVRAGTGCVVVVEGSAGLGKTRLLDECVSMAEELSFRVGRGAAEPGRVIELGALFDALFEGIHRSRIGARLMTFTLLRSSCSGSFRTCSPSLRRPHSKVPCLSVLMICNGAGLGGTSETYVAWLITRRRPARS